MIGKGLVVLFFPLLLLPDFGEVGKIGIGNLYCGRQKAANKKQRSVQ